MFRYKCGIEFEYILLDKNDAVLDFNNIDSSKLLLIVDQSRNNQKDLYLNTGDLGIKGGYWYAEGDERFDEKGNFIDIKIKGLEIRTPVKENIEKSVEFLLNLEKELKNLLSPHNIHLGIIGFNPKTREYSFEPPLNEWEKAMRLKHKEYDYAEVSNLSYGPDINLSSDKWNEEDCIDIAEKLTYYSPYMVPFSFSSPFFDNKIWQGLSKRTFERTWRRPAVKAFTKENLSTLPTKKAKNVNEIGRIEFKSFDAILSKELLLALSSLTLGVALANLPGRLKAPDKAMHQLVAVEGFRNEKIYIEAEKVLNEASKALLQNNLIEELSYLDLLKNMLLKRESSSDLLIKEYSKNGKIKIIKGLNL